MSYITKKEIADILERVPEFKEFLYTRGFIVTDEKIDITSEYPFYDNWSEIVIDDLIYIYANKNTQVYTYTNNGITCFLIGHAYDPYKMIIDEDSILKVISESVKDNHKNFFESISELTGVYLLGYIRDGKMVFLNDAAGMQLTYSGVIDGHIYISPFAKLVADIKNLKQPEYIQRLVSNKYWHYWGNWLPGDLSPFEELKRVVPNNAYQYEFEKHKISHYRFYPLRKIVETKSEKEYMDTIHELGEVMANTMRLISEKWPDKKVSISMTGGRDSTTTLACSKEVFDKFSYFSYISNVDESVDAYAARDILKHLGLKHELYKIPKEYEDYKYLEEFDILMQCNNGCIGKNNKNDLEKRLFFLKNKPCDIEVKSWVNELGRSFYYGKYLKKKFPKYPTGSYLRAMHKIYLSKYLMKNTDKVFNEYLDSFYPKEIMDNLNWLELYAWEFAWSSGEGCFLTTEHRITYDITIPFNNRRYIDTMMRVPVEKRKTDQIPIDLVQYMEPRITETNIAVHDISHTRMRSYMVRAYLELFSKIKFR